MRQGKNPFKKETAVAPPARITVGVLNCIPNQSGYYARQLDALRLCLASLRHEPGAPFELMVVDNGSCAPVRQFLQAALADGSLDYLILNHRNVGRPNGVRQVLRSAPGDLVVYSDGDIYYHPGWLAAHLAVFEGFPDVGMVGGLPIRHLADYYTTSTLRWIEEQGDDIEREIGALISEEEIRTYYRSLGYDDIEAHVRRAASGLDRRVRFRGAIAHVGASHMQFLMPRAVIDRLPHRRFERATGLNPEIMDAILEDEGLLRLSTPEPVVYHIGNAIGEEWLRDRFDALVGGQPAEAAQRSALWRRWRVRRLVMRLHDWSFRTLYGTEAGPGERP